MGDYRAYAAFYLPYRINKYILSPPCHKHIFSSRHNFDLFSYRNTAGSTSGAHSEGLWPLVWLLPVGYAGRGYESLTLWLQRKKKQTKTGKGHSNSM